MLLLWLMDAMFSESTIYLFAGMGLLAIWAVGHHRRPHP